MTGTIPSVMLDKPLPAQIDVCGLTHPGRVRKTNADHFLVASFHRAMVIHSSSLGVALPALSTDSRGYVFLVADGVGALPQAGTGSERAIESVARSLTEMSEVCMPTQPQLEREMAERLRAAVSRAHEALLELGKDARGAAATTLTALVAIWPRVFIIHAGDSRCYRLREGELERFTVDQTMAQALVEAGAVRAGSPEEARLKNVLVSALGSAQLEAQVIVSDLRRGDVLFLCTDGLTRHVSDDEIRERLSSGAAAERICHDLVDLALERGGVDNITVVVGRRRTD